MKKLLLVLLILAITPFIKTFANEKQPDLRENVAPATRAILINSQLDAGDQTFISNYYYEAYTFTSNINQNLEVYVSVAGCPCITDDPYIYLYDYPFDPLNYLTNLIVSDDDGGAGCCSAIIPAEGIALVAGQQYVLVVSSYSGLDTFDYELNIQSDVTMGEVVVPITNWALFIGIGLILMFAVVRFRKMG